jgi:hypothetical protein
MKNINQFPEDFIFWLETGATQIEDGIWRKMRERISS